MAAYLMQVLAKGHYQRPLAWWLWGLVPVSGCYALGLVLRRLWYWCGAIKPVTVACPVISIGNLTTGGTGKTPVTKALAAALVAQGRRVVILSRGYGASQPQAYARATSPAFGDEAYELQQAVPQAVVLVGRKRAKNVVRAVADYQPEVILLDDGFQYWPLARSYDVVLVDAQRQLGNGHLLPVGPLREPGSALKRAQAIVLTHCPPEQLPAAKEALQHQVGATLSQADWWAVTFEATGVTPLLQPGAPLPLTVLKKRPVVVLSALASATRFVHAVEQAGATITQHLDMPDHATADATTIAQLEEALADEGTWLLMTAKDASKWASALQNHPLAEKAYVLQWQAVLPEGFITQVLSLLPPSS